MSYRNEWIRDMEEIEWVVVMWDDGMEWKKEMMWWVRKLYEIDKELRVVGGWEMEVSKEREEWDRWKWVKKRRMR